VRAAAADDLSAGRHRRLGGAVGGSVVGDPQRGLRQRPAQSRERRRDPVGLVAGGDDHDQAVSCLPVALRLLSRVRRHARIFSPLMVDIEAHITGNVWKIEVAVGDQVEDGDTVVILESMKMEIPVEAEDDGTVKEIRCEEGQSVSEGDVLVVIE
jgi:acetyl-CoA carboxylase biotin carboxyl carrier protein